jgi:hypothetical protein
MEELYSTEGDYGLRTLSEPDEAVVEYDALCHYAGLSHPIAKGQLYIQHVLIRCSNTESLPRDLLY